MDYQSEAAFILDKSLSYLERNGISFRKTPTFAVRDDLQLGPYTALALANISPIVSAENGRNLARQIVPTLFAHKCKLHISENALTEYLDWTNRAVDSSYLATQIAQLPKENVVFSRRGMQLIESPVERVAIGVHELWHLFEEQDGVFAKNPLLTEAIPCYVQSLMGNSLTYCPPSEVHSMQDFRYLYATDQVSQMCAQEKFHLHDLLKPAVRNQLEAKLLPSVASILAKTKPTSSEIRFFKQFLSSYPSFLRAISQDFSHDTLLHGYRLLGLDTLADDLQFQDTSLLIADMRTNYGIGAKPQNN